MYWKKPHRPRAMCRTYAGLLASIYTGQWPMSTPSFVKSAEVVHCQTLCHHAKYCLTRYPDSFTSGAGPWRISSAVYDIYMLPTLITCDIRIRTRGGICGKIWPKEFA